MVDFPEAEAVEAELAKAGPLAVLFGHGCSAQSHALHGRLTAAFRAAGLTLLLDQFGVGDDVQVAMRRLEIHGLIFHATPKAVASDACAVELRTAHVSAAPILCLRDQAPIPKDLQDRIFLELTAPGEIEPADAARLADAMSSRVRVHWVWEWLMETSRAVREREGGVNWLLNQPPQVLAEFFEPLTRLHHLEKEDPTVSSRLAELLERTGLRSEAREHLRHWWHAVEHPLSRDTITDIFNTWGFPAPGPNTNVTQHNARWGKFSALGVSAILVTGILAVKGCHFELRSDGSFRGGVGDDFYRAWALHEKMFRPAIRQEDL